MSAFCHFLVTVEISSLSIFLFVQMSSETQRFLEERSERIRLLHEKQERELEEFDEESARLGFRLVRRAEISTKKKLEKPGIFVLKFCCCESSVKL